MFVIVWRDVGGSRTSYLDRDPRPQESWIEWANRRGYEIDPRYKETGSGLGYELACRLQREFRQQASLPGWTPDPAEAHRFASVEEAHAARGRLRYHQRLRIERAS